jgi:hypothetical protein
MRGGCASASTWPRLVELADRLGRPGPLRPRSSEPITRISDPQCGLVRRPLPTVCPKNFVYSARCPSGSVAEQLIVVSSFSSQDADDQHPIRHSQTLGIHPREGRRFRQGSDLPRRLDHELVRPFRSFAGTSVPADPTLQTCPARGLRAPRPVPRQCPRGPGSKGVAG